MKRDHKVFLDWMAAQDREDRLETEVLQVRLVPLDPLDLLDSKDCEDHRVFLEKWARAEQSAGLDSQETVGPTDDLVSLVSRVNLDHLDGRDRKDRVDLQATPEQQASVARVV